MQSFAGPPLSQSFHTHFAPSADVFALSSGCFHKLLLAAVLDSLINVMHDEEIIMVHPHAKRDRHSTSRGTVAALAVAVFAMPLWLTAAGDALGQSTGPVAAQARTCPKGYTLVDLHPAYCLSNSGDVVLPEATYRPAALGKCPEGHGGLDATCISPPSTLNHVRR
jgi:hypothetical protein